MLFENARDFNMRLAGTIIRLKETPILVRECEDEARMRFKYLRSGRTNHSDIEDERINIMPVKLGYYNRPTYEHGRMADGCSYLTRKPGRRYKQGLDMSLLHVVGRELGHRFSPDNRALADTIQGKYTPLEECAAGILNQEYTSRAFDRDFCLSLDGDGFELGYKGRLVGTITLQNRTFELYPGCEYVTESLEEVLNEAA